MQSSYTSNYLKIYFWQGISFVLNFLSLFIVTPYLSSMPSVYGIYIVCVSVNIFMAYADLGFISAGQKYAAECFVREERENEIRIIGFSNFILLVFAFICSAVFLYLSYYPHLLIKAIPSGNESVIASQLLLILAIFSPTAVLQRVAQMIFGIRLEDYLVQRINIGVNLIRILAALYFFRTGQYDIVGYSLFSQLVGLIGYIIVLLIARKRYSYNFKLLFKSCCFTKAIFLKTKTLAFNSLYLTAAWILYYELDPFVIGKVAGADKVAIYAIGLTVLSFFRAVLGILFTPFGSRFNHFIGRKDYVGLKAFYLHIVTLMAPLVVFPIVIVVLLAKPFVFSWVGGAYTESIPILILLSLCNLFAFISYPAGMLLTAREQLKELYLISSTLPLIFWIGIVITYSFLGLNAFAFFKTIAFSIMAIVYLAISKKIFEIAYIDLFKKVLLPLLFPILLLITFLLITREYLPLEKSKINLLMVMCTGGVAMVIAMGALYFTSSLAREYVYSLKNSVYKK